MKIIMTLSADKNKEYGKSHFGDSYYFLKYDMDENGKVEFIDEILNSAKNTDETHSDNKKMGNVKSIIGECDCVIASQMSPNFKKLAEKSKLQPLVVKGENKEDALSYISKNFEFINFLVQKRKMGERNTNVPIIKKDFVFNFELTGGD